MLSLSNSFYILTSFTMLFGINLITTPQSSPNCHPFEKHTIYYRGDYLYSSKVDKRKEIWDRGFEEIVASYSSDRKNFSNVTSFFNAAGFEVIALIDAYTDGGLSLKKHVDPFYDLGRYKERYESLDKFLKENNSSLKGIIEDFELYPFTKVIYYPKGGKNLDESIIYNPSRILKEVKGDEKIVDRKSFMGKYGYQLQNLTLNNIQFNYPIETMAQQKIINIGFLLGWCSPDVPVGEYHRVIQTFRPSHPSITRIDIKIKRCDYGEGSWPFAHIRYYLAKTKNGIPVVKERISNVYYLKNNEINYNGNSQDDFRNISDVKLYFDPSSVEQLNMNEQYALVLEFAANTSNEYSRFISKWDQSNKPHYRLAAMDGGKNSGGDKLDPYPDGMIWKGRFNGTFMKYSDIDLMFTVYHPEDIPDIKPNQLHSDWIDYQSYLTKCITLDYKKLTEKYNLSLYIYSGYQTESKDYFGENTKERYSMDWTMMKDAIDYAMCGYQPNLMKRFNYIDSLQRAVGNNVKVIGGIVNLQTNFRDTYDYCSGGVMYGWWVKESDESLCDNP